MDPLPAAAYVPPNPQIPKVLGILNILFASALMICGLCTIFYVSMLPVWGKFMDQAQKQVRAQEDKDRKAALEEIAAAEEEATTEEQKADLKARRKEVENRPRMSATLKMDLSSTGLTDRRLAIYAWVEFLTGLTLNLMMMAAGIGLVMRRLWGLRLGMWVAAMKIVRLVLVYGYAALVIVPLVSVGMAKFQMQAIAQQQQAIGKPMPPGFTVETFSRGMSIWFASCAVAVVVVGSIYPLVSLWLLSRPGARAACSAKGKAPGADETW